MLTELCVNKVFCQILKSKTMKYFLILLASFSLATTSCQHTNEAPSNEISTEIPKEEKPKLKLTEVGFKGKINAGESLQIDGEFNLKSPVQHFNLSLISKETKKVALSHDIDYYSGIAQSIFSEHIFIPSDFKAELYDVVANITDKEGNTETSTKELSIAPPLFNMTINSLGEQGKGYTGKDFNINATVKANDRIIKAMRVEIISKQTHSKRIDTSFKDYKGKTEISFNENIPIPQNFPKGEYYIIIIAYDLNNGYTYFENLLPFY